ncbi:hypothetical protein CW304_33100 [Bacillus sp. UFRGS-B20]|nr:hypothetical protein CW304_33100 [Bacillus sp. UFRGS-B20]
MALCDITYGSAQSSRVVWENSVTNSGAKRMRTGSTLALSACALTRSAIRAMRSISKRLYTSVSEAPFRAYRCLHGLRTDRR